MDTVSLGVGELCLNSSLSLMAPPSIVTFNTDSLSNKETDSSSSAFIQCTEINVVKLSQSSFVSSKDTSISLTFRKRKTSQENVWNDKDAPIGDTIGDGIELQFSSQVKQLTHVKVCLMAQTDSQFEQHPSGVIDFGFRKADRIYALGAQVTVDRELICVDNLTITQDRNTFFPIWRLENLEDDTKQTYSTGQLAVYAVMFVLYLIPFSILASHEILVGFSETSNTRLFNFTYTLALFTRCIYFLGLLIAKPTGSESVVEFLAAEFPTIVYLSAVSAAAMLWATVKVARMKAIIQRIAIAGILFLYLVFVVFAVVFFEFQGSSSYSCFGLIESEPDQSNQDILRIIYYSILCIFSLIVGCITLYFSGSLVRMVFGSSSAGTNPRLKKWLIVTLVCSTSVVCQCVFALVYTLSITPTYQYAFLLIGLEIIPSLPVLGLVLSDEVWSSSAPSKTNKTSSGMPKQTSLPDLNTKSYAE